VNLDHVATVRPKGSRRHGMRDHLCWRRSKRNRCEGRSKLPHRQVGCATL